MAISTSEKKSSILFTSFNLINTIIGAGIVGIPYSIKQCGFYSGIVTILICAYLTQRSLVMLLQTAHEINATSYEQLCKFCFGSKGYIFISINMAIMAYGGMVGYLMVVRDSLPIELFVTDDSWKREEILVILSFCIMFPLSTQRDMASLSKTSSLNVLIDSFLVLLVAYTAYQLLSYEELKTAISTSPLIHASTYFMGIGIISFAFQCQHSAFILSNSLSNPTLQRWSIVTKIGLCIACLLALIMGISGYLAFQSKTLGNIITNLSHHESSTQSNSSFKIELIARLSMSITMFFVYPIECFVARHVCYSFCFGENYAMSDISFCRHFLCTFGIYLLTLVPACTINDLGGVFAVTGAVGGSCLMYITPGLIFLSVFGHYYLSTLKKNKSCFFNIISFCSGMVFWEWLIRRISVQKHAKHSMGGMIELQRQDSTTKPLKLNDDLIISDEELNGSFVEVDLDEEDEVSQNDAKECTERNIEFIPTFSDFIIAIGYVIFGFMAMIAGLIAIYDDELQQHKKI